MENHLQVLDNDSLIILKAVKLRIYKGNTINAKKAQNLKKYK